MFTRVIYEDSTAIVTILAFAVAASIFLTISWRALRMTRPQVEHYENLPFLIATPACGQGEGDDHAVGQGPRPTSEVAPQLRS